MKLFSKINCWTELLEVVTVSYTCMKILSLRSLKTLLANTQSEAQIRKNSRLLMPYFIHSIVFHTEINSIACPMEQHSL